MTYLPALHSVEDTRAWIRDAVLPELEVWVAEADGRVVGFVALGAEMLEHLYVVPEWQSLGHGAELLGHAKERRPAGLRLWVFQRNDGARRFYERHGFRLVGVTDGSNNEEREPDALYAFP